MPKTQVTFDPGQKVGEWKLIEYRRGMYEGRKCTSEPAWKCQCSCGTLRWVQSANLRSGASVSCGCASLHASKKRHAPKNLRMVNSVFALGGL